MTIDALLKHKLYLVSEDYLLELTVTGAASCDRSFCIIGHGITQKVVKSFRVILANEEGRLLSECPYYFPDDPLKVGQPYHQSYNLSLREGMKGEFELWAIGNKRTKKLVCREFLGMPLTYDEFQELMQ